MRRDLRRAALYYRAAALQGDTWAQTLLGICYRDGEGVKRSRRWAAHWWRKAAAEQPKAARELARGPRAR